MIDTFAPEALRFRGSVRTGKTARLVERVAACAASDGPESVVAFCASPQAARAFELRLQARLGDAARAVRVTTPRAFALDVLSGADAVALTGRDARLLVPFEEKFLFEDLMVSGLRPKRLREMLKFFHRSWTELADDDPAWLITDQETNLHALLKESLAFMRGVLEPEAANLAVRALRQARSRDEKRAAHAFAHVVVDDYPCLSRASQMMTELVARTSIAVAGDADACVEAFDSYPYAAGLDEFAERHPNAELVELEVSGEGAAERTLAASDVLSCDDPSDEFARVAAYVADAVESGVPASHVVVASPHPAWTRGLMAALDARDVPAEALPSEQPLALRGDVRDDARCTAARLLTALELVADPRNATAWRCWCGFGDYLLNSAAFAHLRAQGRGLVEALAAAEADDGVVGMARVVAAYQAGTALIEHASGLAGAQLLDELARAVTDGAEQHAPDAIVSLCLDDAADAAADAAAMARRARTRLMFPRLSDEHAVTVVPYRQVIGLSPDVLVVAGFMNGFLPRHAYFDDTTPPAKRARMLAEDASVARALAGKAPRQAVSYCTTIDLESAGPLNLKINRIRMKKGVRLATISKSVLLEEAAEER